MSGGSRTQPDSAGHVGARSRRLVLIVEDEPDNQAILQTVVETLVGARTAVVSDGLRAVDAALESLPDLVLLDLMMPLLDGFQVARRLKADPRTRQMPIIAISALVRPGDREAAIEAGCDEFVRKPFDLDELEGLIVACLDGSRRSEPLGDHLGLHEQR